MRQVPFHKASAGARESEAAATAPAAPPAKPPFDPWRVVRRSLVGRYRFACWLGVWGAVVGCFLGWWSSPPVYRSEGLVRIASVMPQVMAETDQNRPMAMFDAYLQSQQMLLSSRGLLEMALEDEAWQALGRKRSKDEVQLLANNLKVEFRPHTDYLRIFFTDSDPNQAAAAVRALINSYEKVYQTQQDEVRRQRVKALEERRVGLAQRIQRLELDLNARVKENGTSDLEPLQHNALQRSMKLEASLAEVRRAITAATQPSSIEKPTSTASNDAGAADQTPEQMAMTDPILRGYLEAQAKRDDEVVRLRAAYLPQHPQLTAATQAAERGRKRIDEYVRLARVLRNSAQPSASTIARANATAAARPLQALRAEEESLVTQQAALKQELTALGAERFRMDRLLAEEEATRKELTEVTRRMGVIDTEEALGGRLSVISRGDVPLAPLLNPHLRGAAVGLLAGFLIPGGILVVCAAIRPQYRNCVQVAADLSGAAPAFAALPKLPEGLTGTALERAAARCVHQLRVKLGANVRERRTSIFMVTSAGSGEGKTNVALALGASFAAAGFRTLVVDGDFERRGVTRGMGCETTPGLREATQKGTLRGHVRGTREGLWILPAGVDDHSKYAIPPTAVDHLLGEARCHFEVILVDTGAVFGSVETSVLAPLSDGVVFVLARGQREALVEQSLQHLASLGSKLCAVVFNGAQRSDFERAIRSDATESVFAADDKQPEAAEDEPSVVTGFGPVLDCVVSSLPPKQVNKFKLLYHGSGAMPQAPMPKAA